MKTLIILFILCTCVAMGQEKSSVLFHGLTKEQADAGIDYEISHSLIRVWDEYVKECWKDSTEAGICVSWIPDSIQLNSGGFIQAWKTTYRQEYVHRHKPTFEGFIEWLRKRK